MKNKILIILFFFFGVSTFYAQTQKAYLEAAEFSYEEKDFYSALVYYQNALEFQEDDMSIRYKLAESARNFNSYVLAEENYQFVVDNQSDNEFAASTYYLAYVKQMQGKYQEAMDLYDLYLSENSGDDVYLTARADKERAAAKWALEELMNPDESIIVENMGSDINTTYSDFGPAMNGDDLYYSSMRFDGAGKDSKKITKLLIAEDAEMGTKLESPINENVLHVANAAFSKDHSKVFYTVCDNLNNTELRCDIYCRVMNSDGSFGDAKKLPEFINKPGYTTTHPTVGYDAARDKEILYFASDRDGGMGKLDIWSSIIDNKDNFTAPTNLEDINTTEDEITPFYHIASNTLYFSSNGYRSFGGFDVFSSKMKKEGFGEPDHLNSPLNSSYHDIYFVLGDDGTSGYFATNREGASFIDEIQKACCFDIYSLKFEPLDIDLNALTFDKFSQDSLLGATVKLYDEDTGELIAEVTNDNSADHLFKLIDRCRNYLIVGEKVGYKSDSTRISTCGMKQSEEIIKKLYLEPDLLDLDVLTFVEADKSALEGCTVTLYDLTDKSKEPVVITNATANDFNFSLTRGHNYRVIATKFGFTQASTEFGTDNISGTSISKRLYLARDFEARLSAYLPLKLYFDNDRPDPRSTKRTTNRSYSETYQAYINKQDEFVQNSANPTGISEFFEYDVKPGFDKLQLFLTQLEKALIGGETFEISIRGFASPRAQSEYNLILGQRRVRSIERDINDYNGGALLKYIANGQLIVTDVSFGESLAPKDISDSFKNRKLSVYSVEASKERRVEIIDVTQKEE